MKPFHQYALWLILPLGLILSGCGKDGGGDNASADEAKAAAISALATTLNTTARAISGATSGVNNAGLKVSVGNRLLSVPVSDAVKKKITAQLDAKAKKWQSANKNAARYFKSLTPKDNSIAAAAAVSEDVVDTTELNRMLVVDSVSGNTVTYKIDATVVCDIDTECSTEVGKISVVQTLDGSSGTIAIKYSDATVLTIGYASNSVYFEVDLAEWKKAAVASGEDVTNVTAFEGGLRITFTVENSTLTQEKVSAVLGITKEVNIVDTLASDPFNLQIAAATTAVSVAADNGTDTATFIIGFGMIHINEQESDWDCITTSPYTCTETTYQAITHFNAITGTFVVSGSTLTATNVGIGGEMYWDKDADTTKDERVLLTTFDFTATFGAQDTVTFVKALDLSITGTDPVGTETTTASAGTVLTFYEVLVAGTYPYYETVTKVTAGGPYAVTSTVASAVPLSAAVDTCFKDNDTDGLPPQATDCP